MTLHRLAACLFVAGTLAWTSGHAHAQIRALPPEVISAGSLSEEQRQAIREYPGDAISRLASGDSREVRTARERLLEPLRAGNASLQFKQAYSDAISKGLSDIAAGSQDLAAVNALRVLGELGTPAALDTLEARLADQRGPVRYAAVMGIERTLNAMRSGSLAITVGRATQSLEKVGALLGKDTQPEVAQAAARAIASLLNLDRAGLEEIRSQALSQLAARVRERAGTMKGPAAGAFMPALLTAAQAARDALTTANPALALPEAARRQAAEISGDAFAAVVRAASGPGLGSSAAVRADAAAIVATTEAAILVSAGRQTSPLKLDQELRKGTSEGDASFVKRAPELVRVLSGPPLGFPADRFF